MDSKTVSMYTFSPTTVAMHFSCAWSSLASGMKLYVHRSLRYVIRRSPRRPDRVALLENWKSAVTSRRPTKSSTFGGGYPPNVTQRSVLGRPSTRWILAGVVVNWSDMNSVLEVRSVESTTWILTGVDDWSDTELSSDITTLSTGTARIV